jgi:hypothetical protein
MARTTRPAAYGEQIGETFETKRSAESFLHRFKGSAVTNSLPLEDRIPLFLSAPEESSEQLDGWPPEQQNPEEFRDRAMVSPLMLKTGILAVVAAIAAFAIVSVQSPLTLFANAKASLIGTAASQPAAAPPGAASLVQSAPVPSAVGTQKLPATAMVAPTREEIAAAFKAAHQREALFKQFQSWQAEQSARAQQVPAAPKPR